MKITNVKCHSSIYFSSIIYGSFFFYKENLYYKVNGTEADCLINTRRDTFHGLEIVQKVEISEIKYIIL